MATNTTPELAAFLRAAAKADYVPVYRRLLSDAFTPVQAFYNLDVGEAACLFESVIGGEKVGRYSFFASDPIVQIQAHGTRCRVSTRQDSGTWSVEETDSENPLEVLRNLIQSFDVYPTPELPPFVGGAVGYAGYDTVRYVEHLPDAPPDDRGIADMYFALYDHMVVFDHVQKTVLVIVLVKVAGLDESRLRKAYDSACKRLDWFVEQMSKPGKPLTPACIDLGTEPSLPITSNFEKEQFEQVVRDCVEYIRAGDIFQVVVSQRMSTPLSSSPLELYRTLRVINPSPFMFYARTPEITLVGSSPEIMVRVVNGEVTVRPLAGTRRRGKTEEEDRALAEELLADPKECAEHVMLVDLGRNDVGRVARYGSVEVSDVMVIERYSHVMHITSNVSGQLQEGYDAFDALAACLPAGTVSGAPKVRAMEIIDEFEPTRRGPYAGAVGHIDFAGNLDTCIALRTIVVQDGVAYVQAGAGIVADSVPETEYQETMNKARGLLTAIQITEDRLGGSHK